MIKLVRSELYTESMTNFIRRLLKINIYPGNINI